MASTGYTSTSPGKQRGDFRPSNPALVAGIILYVALDVIGISLHHALEPLGGAGRIRVVAQWAEQVEITYRRPISYLWSIPSTGLKSIW